ncbi:hypothetical protein BIV25_02710 [Streptomyces sp. MUSC 14]|nr:hypothetical protein BIV25_02710 [Streptomyces sp. MUSC 14]
MDGAEAGRGEGEHAGVGDDVFGGALAVPQSGGDQVSAERCPFESRRLAHITVQEGSPPRRLSALM